MPLVLAGLVIRNCHQLSPFWDKQPKQAIGILRPPLSLGIRVSKSGFLFQRCGHHFVLGKLPALWNVMDLCSRSVSR
ncbi:Uncharacterised protein [Salmonella enterica subsp. enterica]|nr:Uncharacterised protein [Salmonella enterica subsp. enterica] [Salmonella enterica subsp. enterica serovar Sundsvall]